MQYTRFMAEQAVRFFVRVPDDVMAEVKAWARDEGRSVNNLIVYVIRRALREWRQAA